MLHRDNGPLCYPPPNDSIPGAIDLTALVDSLGTWCSATDTITYTTVNATLDGDAPSCLESGHNSNGNVWFKYTAGSTGEINFQVINGFSGAQQYSYISLWEDTDPSSAVSLTEVQCEGPTGQYSTNALGVSGLVEGRDYYIMVHPANTGWRGAFQVCIADRVSFDFAEGAIDLTPLADSNNGTWCSAADNIIYTSYGATADRDAPGCLQTGHNHHANVWFKYKVGPSGALNFELNTAGLSGIQQLGYISLWQDSIANDSALTLKEVQCEQYTGWYTNNALGIKGLVENEYYYIMVNPAQTPYAGYFGVCISDQVSFDFSVGAVDVTDLVNSHGGEWCSSEDTVTYSSNHATVDESAPSCLTGTHNHHANVWFKYTANGTGQVNVELRLNGVAPPVQRYGYISLWTDSDTTDTLITLTEIQCEQYVGQYSNNALGVAGLTEGRDYYIMVHPSNPAYDGNFQVCFADRVSFDFAAGAIDLTPLVQTNGGSWCSADDNITYSSNHATVDETAPSCLQGTHNHHANVWFKYTAGPSRALNFELNVSGLSGPQRYGYISLWTDDDPEDGQFILSEVQCEAYTGQYTNNALGVDNLIEGRDYYFMIHPYISAHDGNFQVCIADKVSFDFIAGAVDLTARVQANGGAWCSADDSISYTSNHATVDGPVPGCLTGTHNSHANVWFKYTASESRAVQFKTTVSGLPGPQQRYSYISMWTDSITTDSLLTLKEVRCAPYTGQYTDNVLETGGLTEGQDYYIMVHPANPSYDGNFQVCISERVSYDFIEGAIDLTAFVDSNGYWSSLDSGIVYSNVGATPDGDSTSCGGAPGANVWFKYINDSIFSIINFAIRTGGSEGTIDDVYITAWVESSGFQNLSEISCTSDTIRWGGHDCEMNLIPIWPNSTVYFSVQSISIQKAGTFSLDIAKVSLSELYRDYYHIAMDISDEYDPAEQSFIVRSTDTIDIINNLRIPGSSDPNDCTFPSPCSDIYFPAIPGYSCDPKFYDPFGNRIHAVGWYGSDTRQRYYVYLPENYSSDAPIVVLIHGGGWHSGPNPETINGFPFNWGDNINESLVKDLLDNNFVVVSGLYRLTKYLNDGDSPPSEVLWEDQLDDISDMIEHIRNNFPLNDPATCLNLEANEIHVLGESAGGHLSLLYAYERADPDYVKSVISMYAPTNINGYGRFLLDFPIIDPETDQALSYTCGQDFIIDPTNNESHFPYWWLFPINHPATVYNSNVVTCEPPSSQDAEFDFYFGMTGGDYKVGETYNLLESSVGVFVEDPSMSTIFEESSPWYSLASGGNQMPTFIMHGKMDALVPYGEPVEGMREALRDYGGLINTINGTFGIVPTTSDYLTTFPNKRHLIKRYDFMGHGWRSINELGDRDKVRSDVLDWLNGH